MSTPTVSRRQMLRTGTLAGVGFATGWISSPRARAQGAIPGLPKAGEDLVRQYLKEFDVPGMQLAYVRGARTLYNGCFGEADRERHKPVKPQSLFRIASTSKAFTAAAIFRLIEAGKLQLQDRVFAPDGILRQFAGLGRNPDWLHSITIHQLLTHTCGGWGNDENDPMFEEAGKNHPELIKWTLETHALQHPPGEKYAYSNFGYCVLGRVIERKGGRGYAQFVREEVMQPAKIRDMRIGTHKPAPAEVRYYGQGGEVTGGFPISRMDAHGGWISTAWDMANFLACLFSPADREGAPAILEAGSLKQMTTGSAANPNYACGFAVNKFGNAWHSGSLPGTTSLMVHTHGKMSWAAVLNTRSEKKESHIRLDNMLWQIARTVPEWRV